MLTAAIGRKIFFGCLLVLFVSCVLIETSLYFERRTSPNCSFSLPLEFLSAWPSVPTELRSVHRFLPHQTCAFIFSKSLTLSLAGGMLAAVLGLCSFKSRMRRTLFNRKPAPFLTLLALGALCSVLFYFYPIFNVTAVESIPWRRYTLLRTSIMSPLLVSFLLSIGLLGFMIEDDEERLER